MKKWKQWISINLAGLLMAGTLFGAGSIDAQAAEYWPDNVSVSSGAAIVVEMETGKVLYEKNADETYYPASITKIMTAMLALEHCDLDETVTFSEKAVYENEGDTSHIAREVGEEMTMESCLYGMMLESANECAWAIGEHVAGGSMEDFVNMMNARAKELGCTNTHFANPNGLPDSDHYVSARDMALIARAAYQIPKFQEICGTRAYTIPADNKKEAYNCNNTHGMISNHRGSTHLYEYALGGKTGYTDEAGNTLVTYARKNGMTLLCVVLNSKSPAHYVDTETLFEYCFQNFSAYSVADNVNLSELQDTASTGLLSDKIDLIRIDSEGVVILPNTVAFSDAKASVVPADGQTDAVARIEYAYAGKNVGGANVIYETNDTMTYPFHNVSEEEGGSSIKYFRIDYKTFLVVAAIILAVLLGMYILNVQSGKILLYFHRHGKKKTSARNYRQIHRSNGRNRGARSSVFRRPSSSATQTITTRHGKKIQRTRRNYNTTRNTRNRTK